MITLVSSWCGGAERTDSNDAVWFDKSYLKNNSVQFFKEYARYLLAEFNAIAVGSIVDGATIVTVTFVNDEDATLFLLAYS